MTRSTFSKPLLFALIPLAAFTYTSASHACSECKRNAKQNLGDVSFATSCKPTSQKQLERGLALLHHMMYAEARKTFTQLSKDDTSCPMAHWGIAMTLFQPLWPNRPGETQMQQGAEAINKARELKPGTAREQGYVDATAAFFTDWQNTDYAARIARWSEAQKQLYDANSGDINAATLYALSHLATAPKADKTFTHQKTAGALLEKLYQQSPQHPGVIHYTIHAYDNPLLAKRAVDMAKAYDQIAPAVPHALHMPTHIFVRLGLWSDTISWNIRSAEAALNFPVNNATSHHYPHAVDYLIYGYLQQADEERAEETLAELASRQKYQPTFVSGYALAAAPARYALERRQWAEAAELPVRQPLRFPWLKFPQVEALTHFARALGAARNGQLTVAEDNLRTLGTMLQRTRKAGQDYWATLIEAQHKAVEAWIQYGKGNTAEALSLIQAAADQEDSVDKHPVTPGAVLPLRELLGDMLRLEGEYNDALTAYEASLKISPNRYYSLYGAGRSAEKAGESTAAANYYRRLLLLSGTNGKGRTELAHAEAFLNGN